MILPDSSAWIEYLRATGSPVHRAMHRLVRRPSELAVTEPVVMEVLAGIGEPGRRETIRAALLRLPLLPVGGLAGFEEAAAIFRRCRAQGETVRSLLDCLVAAAALRDRAAILHHDRDFDAIARHTRLRIEPVRA